MRKILLIEDAQEAQLLVRLALQGDYEVKVAETLASGEEALREGGIDLLLLDLGLPDGDGFDLLARLRAAPAHRNLPVIVLTVKTDVEHKVRGFKLGGDDYVTKPFEPLELEARVAAKLRKVDEASTATGQLRIGHLLLDVFYHKAYLVDGGAVPPAGDPGLGLTAKEFELLHLFARNLGRTLDRNTILNAVWPAVGSEGSRTLDRHLSTLRKKLPSGAGTIESVHRVGYRFQTA